MAVSTPVTLESFNQWLDDHESIALTAAHNDVLAMYAFQDGDSSVSGQNTIPVGDMAATQAAAGKQLDAAKQAGNLDEMINILTSSTGNAVTSILGLSQSRTDWNPLDPDNTNNAQGFTNFVKNILKNPLFTTTQSENKTVHYQESNYDSLIDKVVDLYDGISGQDIDQVKKSIANLAKACTSRVNTSNTSTLFVQNTLNAPEGENIVVMLQQSFMMMEYNHNTGKGAPKDTYKTEITVNTLELSFNSAAWNRSYAESLAKKFTQSWDDWLNDTTTPAAPSQKAINFCFARTPEPAE